MRRILMFNRVTADGFFAAADGGLPFTVPDPELDRRAAESIPTVDTMLFGRRTYEQFQGFWSQFESDTGAAHDPHATARKSPELAAMARALNEQKKIVFSRTLERATWKNSRILRSIEVEQIERMKQEPGKDMIIMGSGSIVSELTRLRLIDEYQLVVCPMFLGSGRSLLGALEETPKLELLEARPYPSGSLLLRYAAAS